jgi:regulator of RNase E activity RraA
LLLFVPFLNAQQISKEDLIRLTPEWKGERFEDGRPKVADAILQRMKLVTHEEAWAVLKSANYKHQYEDGWQTINPDSVLVGRAVTAIFVPGRPDIHRVIDEKGHKEDGRIKSQNSWPIDLLVKGDVYVVDQFGAHEDGPTIGDNLGNSIHAKSGNGIVYNGAIRDIDGLKEIGSFTSFFRSYHPSHHLNNPDGELNTTLVGINQPTRIGKATVMPGDVVLEGMVVLFLFRRTWPNVSLLLRKLSACVICSDIRGCVSRYILRGRLTPAGRRKLKKIFHNG